MFRRHRTRDDWWELDAVGLHYVMLSVGLLVGGLGFLIGYLAAYYIHPGYYGVATFCYLFHATWNLADQILLNSLVSLPQPSPSAALL